MAPDRFTRSLAVGWLTELKTLKTGLKQTGFNQPLNTQQNRLSGVAKGRKRKPDLRRIRTSKTYALPDVAKTLDRNVATIRSWVRQGLPLLSEQKPVLVLGLDLKGWLLARWKTKRQKCQSGELFCFKCREPRKPKLESVEIIVRNEKTVSIKGRCEACDTRMNQAGSLAKLGKINTQFCAQTPRMPSLTGCSIPGDKHTSRDGAGMAKGV